MRRAGREERLTNSKKVFYFVTYTSAFYDTIRSPQWSHCHTVSCGLSASLPQSHTVSLLLGPSARYLVTQILFF